jgi:hypothetical protein
MELGARVNPELKNPELKNFAFGRLNPFDSQSTDRNGVNCSNLSFHSPPCLTQRSETF